MNHNFAYIQKVSLSLSLKIIDIRIHIPNQRHQKNLGSDICHVNTTQQSYSLSHDRWRSSVNLSDTPLGSVQWCVRNLCHTPKISSGDFDAVVSLSAWEHIPYELLDSALTEIRRVLTPDAKWAVTTSATEAPLTYWHEPSKSNCFSINDLENKFGAKTLFTQNPEMILDRYRQCSYFKDNLSEFYKKSGNYGMSWGKWEPKYVPVGLSQL